MTGTLTIPVVKSHKMKPEVKKEWVDALRSGDYIQAKGKLECRPTPSTVAHCCLGVLAHKALEERNLEVTDENTCIWLVRFKTDGSGQIPNDSEHWDARPAPGYGDTCLLPADFRSKMDAEIVDPDTRAFVAWTYYEQKSMLGIPFLSTIGESIPIAPHTAMAVPANST